MDNEVLIKVKENHKKILNNTNKLKEKLKKQGKTFNDLQDKLFINVIDYEETDKILEEEEVIEDENQRNRRKMF